VREGKHVTEIWPATSWMALVLLGAYHGVNPAMGWLFAVALGLQQRSRTVVLRSLLPIASGHLASLGVVVLLVGVLHLIASAEVLRPIGAVVLIAFGLYKFLRPRSHPRWVGMRLGFWELGLWSFLMATAHGAGLMLFPILLGFATAASGASAAPAATAVGAGGHQHGPTAAQAPAPAPGPAQVQPPQGPAAPAVPGLHLGGHGLSTTLLGQDLAAVLVHTAAMLLTMGLVAVVVYGLRQAGRVRAAPGLGELRRAVGRGGDRGRGVHPVHVTPRFSCTPRSTSGRLEARGLDRGVGRHALLDHQQGGTADVEVAWRVAAEEVEVAARRAEGEVYVATLIRGHR
jgi:hypothetical protein